MSLSRKDKEQLQKLKTEVSNLEDNAKSIRLKQNIYWFLILIGIVISMYSVDQVERYNWAWYFLIVYPFINFFIITATHLDNDILFEIKSKKAKIIDIEVRDFDN